MMTEEGVEMLMKAALHACVYIRMCMHVYVCNVRFHGKCVKLMRCTTRACTCAYVDVI